MYQSSESRQNKRRLIFRFPSKFEDKLSLDFLQYDYNQGHLSSGDTSSQRKFICRMHMYSRDTYNQVTHLFMGPLFLWFLSLGDSHNQRTPLARGHISSGDTSLQGTHLFRGHISSVSLGDSYNQRTPLFRGHLSSGDTSLQGTHLFRGFRSSGDSPLQGTPLFRRNMSHRDIYF